MSDGEQVQHGVGRATQRDDDGDCILKRSAGQDVERADSSPEHLDDRGASPATILDLRLGYRVLRGTVGQTHAERLDCRRHGIRGVHSSARARTGNGALLDGLKLLVVDLLVCMRADGFEDRHDVEFARIARDAAGQNRAAVNEYRRSIQSRDGDERAGHVFVAAADGHETVHAGAADDGFDGVGDDLARDERIFHAFAAHRDAVRDGDGVEDDRLAAGVVGARLGFQRELVDVHVARGDPAPGRGDADERLLEILRFETDGVEHRAGGCAFGAIQDDARVGAERVDDPR